MAVGIVKRNLEQSKQMGAFVWMNNSPFERLMIVANQNCVSLHASSILRLFSD